MVPEEAERRPDVVLFVDDEPLVVGGLRRLFRGRTDWTIAFASCGEEALEKIGAEPVAAVVTDMRMPGMGGEAFLGKLRSEWPTVVRIVLSGQADEDAPGMRALAHEILGKPCDVELLEVTVQRALAMRALLVRPEIAGTSASLLLARMPPEVASLSASAARASGELGAELLALVSASPVLREALGPAGERPGWSEALVLLGPVPALYLAILAALERKSGAASDWLAAAASARERAPGERAAEEAIARLLVPPIARAIARRGVEQEAALDLDVLGGAEGFARAFGVSEAELGIHVLSAWGLPVSLAAYGALMPDPPPPRRPGR